MNDIVIFVSGAVTGIGLLILSSYIINRIITKDAVKEDDYTGAE